MIRESRQYPEGFKSMVDYYHTQMRTNQEIAEVVLGGDEYSVELSRAKREVVDGEDEVVVIGISGAGAKAGELDVEGKLWGKVAEEIGVDVSMVSLPEHGGSDKSWSGWWGSETDFDVMADVLVKYVEAKIEEEKESGRNRPVILSGWSMGGVLALKLAARAKGVDGVILFDPHVYPGKVGMMAAKFVTDGMVGARRDLEPEEETTIESLGMIGWVKRKWLD